MKRVSGTSRKAHAENQQTDLYSRRKREIIDYLESKGVPVSRQQIADDTGIQLCCVTGRVCDLLEAGKVIISGYVKNPRSGKTVQGVMLA